MSTFTANIYCRSCGQLLSRLSGIEQQWLSKIGENVAKTTKMCSSFCLEKGTALNVMATIVWQKEPVVHAERSEIANLLSIECTDLSQRQSRLRDIVIQLLEDNKP